MAEGRHHQPPGILSLAALADEHGGALNADLIDRGLRLRDAGTPAFTLSDLADIVRNLPKDSALVRALRADRLDPEEAAVRDLWGLPEQLLADVADSLRWLVWSKTKDASRPGAKPPKPIDRPGVEPEHKQHRGTAMPLDQARQRLEVARL